ncbi:urea amidolyase [Pseudoxanthomonas kalamensis DSM 18571]|uniref:5-oxoprolinase subunit PxpB n=1 Tax=Pseudoxanthomonas kalamensis TaxID=289483 RepID=UPI001390DA35|nr:5-oxoprolinase subunit PxpB [Pseudoxanthomonas kalamensis]KAF1709967.1 urea amidolyase [Pseudoxanthomonas kalamensis DSM 18571]
MSAPRFELLGSDAVLVRFGDRIDAALNRRVHAFAARLRAQRPDWLLDLVPAYASLGVYFDPTRMSADDPHATAIDWLRQIDDADAEDLSAGTLHEIPVCYGGEYGQDLLTAAVALGLTADALVARHSAAVYTVAMIGFAPGFPYLLGLDPALTLPRLTTPRADVPAGSVAIGGAQTGIYPRSSPGGWRLLGRTPLPLFDAQRTEPSLLQPGDRVRFVPIDAENFRHAGGSRAMSRASTTYWEVLSPGLQTTVQDCGRHGWRHLGVCRAGAMDPRALALANRLVGNDADAAGLEITLRGPRLRLARACRIALVGATVQARWNDEPLPMGRPLLLPPGELRLGSVRDGARCWLAVAGGIDLPLQLGSRSTDLRGGFGGLQGRALLAGDRLPLAAVKLPTTRQPQFPDWWIDPDDPWTRQAGLLRYLPVDPALPTLTDSWRVHANSNRQGLRLQGTALASMANSGVSEPVAVGTLQLPPDGQPILLLADAQTVGGYPRLGHVIACDLARAAQLRPGDAVRFEAVTPEQAQQAQRDASHRHARLLQAIAQKLPA